MSLIYSKNFFKINSCMYCWVFSRANRQMKMRIKCFSSMNKNRSTNPYLNRMYSSNDDKSSESFQFFDLVNKDRLILFGFGILVAGSLIGYERNINIRNKHKELKKKLHSSVLNAQNAVKEGNYEAAVAHYRESRSIVNDVAMTSTEVQKKVLLNIVEQLGHLAYALNNWSEAEMFLKETEKIMLDIGVEKNSDAYIEVMLRLAKIDVINNRGKEAMDRFKFCIENLERKISVQDVYSEPDSPAYERITLYGMVLTEYGTYAKGAGLLDESERAFSKALNICRNILGPTHEQTSVLANDLATVYDEKGRYNKAIRLAEKAIRIATETAPENLATYKYNLGHILMHQGDLVRARNALRESLKLAEEHQDDETRKLAESSIMKLDISQ
ncbi:tetratricopeptide repeat protein 19, mitochondrial isoform X1 [Hydra vulgaris]|uniref:Tetratricopeptide repeat protein 19, mitochondrial n=1 Tax=Hydra vulgaris TaxID=6087 RepID=T2MC17_HYDVU|nr:tetratricopeptide repeat protein 19, mitochondrial [Hydra vulgaris]